MLWLLQQRALMRQGDVFTTITGTLDRGGVPWLAVHALPLTETIVAADADVRHHNFAEAPALTIADDQPIMTWGSWALALTARKRGWNPGAFVNDHFNHPAWVQGWGADCMLNGSAKVCRLDSLEQAVADMPGQIFVRPVHDTKSFTGMVLERPDLLAWAEQALRVSSAELGATTELVVAPWREISAEYRLFVVDGEIISWSLYKLGSQVVFERYAPEPVLAWARQRIAHWQPDRAFVMDVAQTPEGTQIIEVNTINASRAYAADISKVIQHIECMRW